MIKSEMRNCSMASALYIRIIYQKIFTLSSLTLCSGRHLKNKRKAVEKQGKIIEALQFWGSNDQ